MANRYFVADLPAPGPGVLTGDLAHHLGTVLRARPGCEVVLGDGRGGTAVATVRAANRGTVAVLVAAATTAPPPPLQLQVAFAVPRPARTEWLFEHGTEVGIAVFQPLHCSRARPQGERPERWQRMMLAAAGQCDRAWLPELRPGRELAAWLADPALPDRRFLGSADGTAFTAADRAPGAAVLVVGPEGGFTAEEQAALAAHGFAARRFGPHVLRTETAAVVGAALLLGG